VAELAYDRSGSGPPLVLVHGLGSRRQAWGPVLDAVVKEREVYNLDLPGFGQSPVGERPCTVEGFAAGLQEFFAKIGLERPHFAGNSLGGGIGLELGRRGAIRSLTAFSPIGLWSKAERIWTQSALRVGHAIGEHRSDSIPRRLMIATARPTLFLYAFGNPWKVPDEEIEATVESGRDAPAFVETARRMDFRLEDPGPLGRIPVTIAWGSRDVLVPYWTCSRRARRILPRARHVTLLGCGHVPFYDDPELCAQVLLDGSAG
jgi:pimeloyl-ACP methyl ester carboxylesterase